MTIKSQPDTASIGDKRNVGGEITKLRRNQHVLTILVLLLVVVIFWIIMSVFSSQRSSKILPEVKKMAQSLSPVIDDSVFEKLEEKRVFSAEELADFPIMIQVDLGKGEKKIVPIGTNLATPTPKPTATPTPVPSLLDDQEEDLQ